MEVRDMNYVGIDLHRDFFVAVAQDERGSEMFKKRYENSMASVEDLVNEFVAPPMVVVEAKRNWMWFIQALQKRGCSVQLAHPFRTKAIASARIKTDSIDAKTLCDLLRADLIPQAYIAPVETLDNREIGRARISLVHDQTTLKNRIHAIVIKENLKFSGSDMFGIKGKECLSTQKLTTGAREVSTIYLKQLAGVQESLTKVEEVITQRSSSIPEVKQLQTIPGFGTTTAFLLAAEVGNVNRFTSAKKFTSYFGMVPRLSQSGNHAYLGRITKLGNPYVRWLLVQAAHRYYRMDKEAKRFVDRLSYRAGKKKATVALARKIGVIAYTVLKENRSYEKRSKETLKVCPAIIPERS
jgi:transposase